MAMTITEPVYPGCLYFSGLASRVGLSIDQVNFLLGQLAGLAVATLFRLQLRPGRVGPAGRHLAAAATGLGILLFCYGRDTIHVVTQALLTFSVIRLAPARYVHRLCMLVALVYLTVLHYGRLGRPLPYIDISGPVMVLTMKVTLLAFNIYDGATSNTGHLHSSNPDIQRLSISQRPALLEFVGYAFNFQTVLVGPMVDFRHYRHFIEKGLSPPQSSDGTDKLGSDGNANLVRPSPTRAVLGQLFTAAVTACCVIFLVPQVTPNFFKEEAFYRWPAWHQWGYLYLSGLMGRMKYYTAWSLAGAVCNASGLGFSGLAADGRQHWDAVSNVRIWAVEMGASFREVLQGWNVGTGQWLRLVAYERAARHRTVAVYALSALWHGLDPCYFVTFGVGALCTEAGRAGRRCLRTRAHRAPLPRLLYNAAGWLATRFCIAYLQVPFVLLDLYTALRVYRELYFAVHVSCVAMIVLLPRLLPPPAAEPAAGKSHLNTSRPATSDRLTSDRVTTRDRLTSDRVTTGDRLTSDRVTTGDRLTSDRVTTGDRLTSRPNAANDPGSTAKGWPRDDRGPASRLLAPAADGTLHKRASNMTDGLTEGRGSPLRAA